MEEKVFFSEKQQFRQWWLWLIHLGLIGFVLFKIVVEKDFGNSSKYFVIIPISILFISLILFWIMKLETKIYSDRIELKFFPFGIHKIYKIQDIQKMEVIKYNPLIDYGGWGIRLGAYNVSGNMGLKIHYRDKNNYDNSILIGTQKPEEMSNTIKSIYNV